MFEKELEAKLKKIFKAQKVSYSQPSESKEQECLFVEIETSRNRFKDGRCVGRFEGNITMFGNADKMPFGYFAECIEQANPDDLKDIGFFNVESNSRIFQNIVQRTVEFTYFFNGQYDPAVGTMESVTLSTEEV